ncbi:glycosyltransferase family 2 protein [Sneathiella glossodoripedis]|uniref:glycosyltransferase family 2 protein n=1 Tax=Sneathiella glossodoripedis TaxID=418853 RepID=UPI00046F513D|nr:glycosyltransferase family 2 protein [Sneathiella glossodoripedis]
MANNELDELTVIIVSYNTRDLTLKCLETLFQNTSRTKFKAVLFDNASHDGSADAVARHFPQVELIRSDENLGFAKANNIVAEKAETEWLLLLNPDTEVHKHAIDNLLKFSRQHPEAGITGGRTVFPDGSLNIASCWQKITLWSMFCHAFGLTTLFPQTNLFNPEAMGGWKRDTVRHVDIVSGCFFMIRKKLWSDLGGFNLKYVMYGEEADLCLRAKKQGYSPMITPDAQIMHLVGASSDQRLDKTLLILKAKITLIIDHWPRLTTSIGLNLMKLYVFIRCARSKSFSSAQEETYWQSLWQRRKEWMQGYN